MNILSGPWKYFLFSQSRLELHIVIEELNLKKVQYLRILHIYGVSDRGNKLNNLSTTISFLVKTESTLYWIFNAFVL